MSDRTIEVTGIRELRKALKDVEADLPRELRDGLFEIATLVADAARVKVPSVSGDAAGSIKARKQSAAASLAVGGTKAPYFPWLDFGGAVGRNRSVKRPFLKEGRYVYPTLKEKRNVITEKVDALIKTLAVKAGFETSGDVAK